jgi:hypothetical protein
MPEPLLIKSERSFIFTANNRESSDSSELDDDKLCDICMCTKKEKVLPCGHAYCKECIEAWEQKDPTCPMCREERGSIESYNLMYNERKTHKSMKKDLMKELALIIKKIIDAPQKRR